VLDPAVLLLDEPLGALDAKLRRSLKVELKALQERVGITFLYVTHDQEEALTMSDRLAVMRSGKIVQMGVPKEIYDEPADTYVATSSCLQPDGIDVIERGRGRLQGQARRVRAGRRLRRRGNARPRACRHPAGASQDEPFESASGRDEQAGPNRVPAMVERLVYPRLVDPGDAAAAAGMQVQALVQNDGDHQSICPTAPPVARAPGVRRAPVLAGEGISPTGEDLDTERGPAQPGRLKLPGRRSLRPGGYRDVICRYPRYPVGHTRSWHMAMMKTPIEIDQEALATAAEVSAQRPRKTRLTPHFASGSATGATSRSARLGEMADRGDFDESLTTRVLTARDPGHLPDRHSGLFRILQASCGRRGQISWQPGLSRSVRRRTRVLYSARSLADRLEKLRLMRDLFGRVTMSAGCYERAGEVQQLAGPRLGHTVRRPGRPAHRGHRGAGAPDPCSAAATDYRLSRPLLVSP